MTRHLQIDLITPEEAVSLDGLFHARARRTPDSIAYRYFDDHLCDWRELTWAQVLEEITRWQAALAHEGFAPGVAAAGEPTRVVAAVVSPGESAAEGAAVSVASVAASPPPSSEPAPAGASRKRAVMGESVYKIVELVGTSTESGEKAAAAAVTMASQSLRDLRVAEVVELDMVIDDGNVAAYRAKVKVSFKYEGDD